MKHHYEVVIDADVRTVWKILDDIDSMKKWQPSLESITLKSGVAGQPGAVSEIVYDENGRKVTMTETITERRDLQFMALKFEAPMGDTVVVNHFEDIDGKQTRWKMYSNFTFKGLFKLIGIFFSGSIRRSNEGMLHNFKLLAETEQAQHAR